MRKESSAANKLASESAGDKTTGESLSDCPNCHGTGTTRFGVCAYCKGSGRS